VGAPAGIDQPTQLGHGVEAPVRGAALDGPAELVRQLAGPHPGDVQLALHVGDPLARGLVGGRVPDPVEHVVVQLVDRDQAVQVEVGRPGLQALDQGAGEHRGLADAGQGVALERVLHGAGGGEHGPAAAVEALLDVHPLVAPGQRAPGERPAVAAVQQQHDPPGPALGHLLVHERGRHRGRPQPLQAGVGGGEVEAAVVVLDPVAGHIEEQQVLPAPVGEEVLDGQVEDMAGLVELGGHLEAADRRLLEHLGQPLGVGGRRPQLAQVAVLVVGAGDDQGGGGCHPLASLNPGRAGRSRRRPGVVAGPRRPR
jgi:hypothetical protein